MAFYNTSKHHTTMCSPESTGPSSKFYLARRFASFFVLSLFILKNVCLSILLYICLCIFFCCRFFICIYLCVFFHVLNLFTRNNHLKIVPKSVKNQIQNRSKKAPKMIPKPTVTQTIRKWLPGPTFVSSGLPFGLPTASKMTPK